MRRDNRKSQQKGSINVQAYVDIRKLAYLGEWMEKRGMIFAPMQYGKIVQQCIDFTRDYVEKFHAGEVGEYNTISEALSMLESRGFPMGQFEGYGRRGIVKALQEEAYRSEVGSPVPQQTTLGKSFGHSLEEMPESFRNLPPDLQSLVLKSAEELERVGVAPLPSSTQFDEDGIIVYPTKEITEDERIQSAMDYLHMVSGGGNRNSRVEEVLSPYFEEAEKRIQDMLHSKNEPSVQS